MMETDNSRASTRTLLAWQRTAFALGVLATIAIKLTMVNHSWIGLVSAILALVGTTILYVSGYIRKNARANPLFILSLSSFIICLLGITAWVQII